MQVANLSTLQLDLDKRRAIDGYRRLKRIARAGKQWRKMFGRKEDIEGEPRLVSTLASEADLFIWVVESAAYRDVGGF